MTVLTTIAKAGPYAGAGTTGPFTVPFRFLDDSHLRVIRTLGLVETVLVLGTDYTVSGVGLATGTVTLTAPLPVGQTLTVVRNVPATQEADYVPGDAFPAESHEEALDKLTMLVQQNTEELTRAAKLPASNTSDAAALSAALLRVDANEANINAVAGNEANINAVEANSANINTVAGSIGNVNTVGGSIANVNTVAAADANVATVAGSIANVNTVGGAIANVNAVGTNIANVNAVAGNETNINAVAANNADVSTVAGIAPAVSTVAGSNVAVQTVATNIASVGTVALNVADVNTVAGIAPAVSTVAGNNANVSAVAGNNANITAVAGNSTNINTVAGSAANISTVATDIAAVNTAAANIAAIIDAPNQASAAAASAQAAADSYDDFDDRYLGPKTADPTVDNDGDPLVVGALYFNTVATEMRVWNGSLWQPQAASPDTLTERSFLATAGQTSYAVSGGYRVGYTFVWVNGVLLSDADITATDGTTITFASALVLNDEVRILSFKAVGTVAVDDIVGLSAALDARATQQKFTGITVEGSGGTSEWAQASGTDPWIAVITVAGLLATDRPIVDIDLSGVAFADVEDVQADWGLVYRVEASDDNELKLYATDEPTEDFELTIQVVR